MKINTKFIIILLKLIIIIFVMESIIKFELKINKKIAINNSSNINLNIFKNKSILTYINKSEKYLKKKELGKVLMFEKTKFDLIKIKNEINFYIKTKKNDIKNNYFYKRKNPKITLIITLYNQENFIPLIYSSVLNQSFQDIEIIFIDDGSIDKAYNILKKYMKKDKRIIYLKNNVNKGAFYSRI